MTDDGADRPFERRTIRRRLLAAALLALAGSIAVSLVLTFEIVLVNERSALDRTLRQQANHFEADVGDLLARQPSSPDVTGDVAAAVDAFVEREPTTRPYVTVVVVDGTAFATTSTNRTLNTLARSGELDDASVSSRSSIATVHTSDGDLRTLRTPVRIGDTDVGELVVAGSMTPVRAEAFAALQRVLIAGAISLAVGFGVMWLATRRILRPLTQLTDTLTRTGPQRLGERVDVAGNDEVTDLAAEFNALLERLDRADAEREELLASIAHELRTPLAIARGQIDVVAADADAATATGPDERRRLRVAADELDRTSRLVNDLLALGRSGHADFIERRPVTLRHLTDEIELRVEGQGFDTVSVAPGDDRSVDVDVERLLQAVLNCVANAIHHNPPGTSVDVTTALDGDDLVIRVVDDGDGVDPADRARVFEAFVTLADTPQPTHGSGLGLAVVAAVARAHGGTATIEDAGDDAEGNDAGGGGPGTTIVLRMPARVASVS